MKLRFCLSVTAIITATLALNACASTVTSTATTVTSTATPGGDQPFSEEVAMSEIYSTVNKIYCKTQGLTISSSTADLRGYFYQVAPDWQGANLYFPELEQETWESFTAVNLQRIPLPSDLEFSGECPSTYSSCSETHTIQFSPIGFNSKKDQALVARVEFCGGFGAGELYFVKLVDDHWKVTDSQEILIGP